MEKIEKHSAGRIMYTYKDLISKTGYSYSYWTKVKITRYKPTNGKVFIAQEDFDNWQLQNPVDPFHKPISDLSNFRFQRK